MATSTFQERFKNKSTVISHDGLFEINPTSAILKPGASQLHSSVFQSSANYMMKSSMDSHNPVNNLHGSDNSFYGSESVAYTEPVVSNKSPKFREASQKSPKRLPHKSQVPEKPKKIFMQDPESSAKSHTKGSVYTPYTLNDYKSIKPKSYYQLGGLGPASVGTMEWTRKKELTDKRWKYGNEIYFKNAARLPLFPANSPIKPQIIEENPRQRALDFAKKIPKPPLKLPIFSS